MNEKIEYIIVQAGGRGTRMGSLTRNKPKALVPINNLPMIFHMFNLFPTALFIIIGDYKIDVLEKYLAVFAHVNYKVVCAENARGTCSGLSKALEYVPDNKCFMLTWCDLVLPSDYIVPENKGNYIGLSIDFPCRYRFINGKIINKKGCNRGVAGHFIFSSKSVINDVPFEGEFVKWLSTKNIKFSELYLKNAHEYGTSESVKKLPIVRCRPFNSLKFSETTVTKFPLNLQGRELENKEHLWYKKAQECGFSNIPEIYSFEPFVMQRINGINIYETSELSGNEKENILKRMVASLKTLHSFQKVPADRESCVEAYFSKTMDRLEIVRELIPFADQKAIRINGKLCRNIFFHTKEFEKRLEKYYPGEFCFIHGDCTFSNTMLDSKGNIVFLDPRGYFGKTLFFGDEAYDWVKLYYSLFSNYDAFNLKKFTLNIDCNEVELKIDSIKWEPMEECFFSLIGEEFSRAHMKLLLSVIWLSLTTYAWEDYDSICAAFYNGLYYLEDVL